MLVRNQEPAGITAFTGNNHSNADLDIF